MTTVVLLFALGVLLLVLEVVVPGGVLGVIGGLAMLAGCGVAFYDFGTGGGFLAVAVASAALGAALYTEFVVLPKTRWGKRMFLDRAVDAQSQPVPAEISAVIDKEGEALTTMAPSGYVTVDGRRYEARSQSGLIAKGTRVRVIGIDSFHLIVNPV